MKWRIPLSIRFLVWLALNLVILAVVFGLLLRSEFRFEALIAGAAGERVQKVSDVLSGELGSRPRTEWTATLERFSQTYGVRFALLDDRGQPLAGPLLEIPPEVHERMRVPRGGLGGPGGPRRGGPPGSAEGAVPSRRGGPGAMRGFVRAGSPPSYWVVIPMPLSAMDKGRSEMGRLVIQSPTVSGGGLFFDLTPWWLAGGAVLFLSVLWWTPFIGSITRSLRQMTAATEEIAEGKFDIALNDRRGDELGRLGSAINRMSGRLQGFVTGQKRFLGDIAHELCSPLARMEMALGVMDQQATAAQREYLDDLRDDVRHMSGLVNELLSFSKAGLKAKDLALSRVPLQELVAGVVSREAPEDPRVRQEIPPDACVDAEPELLARAVSNLLRNAIRYAGHAGPVTLRAVIQGESVSLTVSDEGPGVPEEALARLGEPFFRPDQARARESGGTGLGLAIVRTCVDACRGRLTLRNRQPAGFEAEVRLKLSR